MHPTNMQNVQEKERHAEWVNDIILRNAGSGLR
jgi:hypothetical protein